MSIPSVVEVQQVELIAFKKRFTVCRFLEELEDTHVSVSITFLLWLVSQSCQEGKSDTFARSFIRACNSCMSFVLHINDLHIASADNVEEAAEISPTKAAMHFM